MKQSRIQIPVLPIMQMKYIFGVDPGSQSWSKFSESLKPDEYGKS